ncbi:MAG TPA: CinA family protein [Burkholderiaceae bacterium]|nr:CinA family protein [Burkholderiaceae bacterium]
MDVSIDFLAKILLKKGWRMATAESCTGGLAAAACTALAGSSEWFERGWVTYSNAAKAQDLGVDATLINAHGAVSEPVARAMAEGAARRAGVAAALSITGIAGPSGGSAAKPVGTVWFGWSVAGRVEAEHRHFPGDRAAVRAAACRHALSGLRARLSEEL